ncbi:MAG: ASCH domain-containing protein [Gammaproteobacteria bacterium]|nr:ASCH domain-containing protein [Gammaproteobacteria bacterium]MDH5592090.1 ASCH domain-containing protein [Gammaproteobacteria bacterium]
MTNTNYPEKSCDIDRLVTHPKLVEAALAGQKTEQRRDGVYAYPGETFELDGIEFTVTGLERKTLGDMTDADAQAEGYPNMEAYKSLILRMHAGMEWNENHKVWVHKFEKSA